MKRKFFIKNLMLFSISIIIPILILGSLSILLTTNYIRKQVETNNANTLNQVKETVDYLFTDIESLNITISTNPTLVYTLRRILNDPANSISMESNIVLNTVIDFLCMKSTSNRSIDSIYIYFENSSNKFISGTERISDIATFYDQDWYELYQEYLKNGKVWSKPRTIRQYSFENNSKKIVSVFQKLSPLNLQSGGVIVANISSDYINRMLNDLPVQNSQSIFIIDRYNDVLFYQDSFTGIKGEMLKSILDHKYGSDFFSTTQNNQFYTVSKIFSERTGLYYVSVTPTDELYRLPKYIIYLTVSLLVLSFLFAIYFAYRAAQKNYSYITNILDTIEAAREGKPLPAPLPQPEDVYSYIISNIIRTFLQYDLLKVQLSEKKYQVQALELLALQSQMNPHFLYNTLGTIYWRVLGLTGKPNEATELIENLSDILRYSLHDQSAAVPLSEEIRNTRSYIAIQEVRHKGSFEVIWQVDEDLLECHVLKLLIQPFVENSLKHGLRQNETIKIKIKVNKSADLKGMKIIVTDNGAGIEPVRLNEIKEMLDDPETNISHIGLFNTNKRIKLACGEEYGIKVYSRRGCATSVSLTIPAVKNQIRDSITAP